MSNDQNKLIVVVFTKGAKNSIKQKTKINTNKNLNFH